MRSPHWKPSPSWASALGFSPRASAHAALARMRLRPPPAQRGLTPFIHATPFPTFPSPLTNEWQLHRKGPVRRATARSRGSSLLPKPAMGFPHTGTPGGPIPVRQAHESPLHGRPGQRGEGRGADSTGGKHAESIEEGFGGRGRCPGRFTSDPSWTNCSKLPPGTPTAACPCHGGIRTPGSLADQEESIRRESNAAIPRRPHQWGTDPRRGWATRQRTGYGPPASILPPESGPGGRASGPASGGSVRGPP